MSRLNDNRKSHYGSSMNPHYMAEWGQTIAKEVDTLIADGKFPILVYRGMSGTTAATAISMFINKTDTVDYAMVYVRKKNEKSHGCSIEHSRIILGEREPVWIVCDDFISTGGTVLEILKAITKFFNIEIPFDSICYALSLDERCNYANTINDVETSVSIRSDAASIVESMKVKYNHYIKRLNQRKRALKTRQAKFCKEMGWD